MCTLVILQRPGHAWPLILGANRDEMADRPWRPPGRHWPDRPEVVAGRDELAGGSWLGLNDHGVAAGVLNRVGSLGPQAGKRSRGELVLEALDHASAEEAATALADLDPAAYRSFNLVVADSEAAYWLRNLGSGEHVEVFPLPPGLSMITAHDRNDQRSPRIFANLHRFEAAPPPEPDEGDWAAWQALLASREHDEATGALAAMTVATEEGFGTSSSSLIALPAPAPLDPKADLKTPPRLPVWLFAPGRPDRHTYRPVEL
ncbi:MAG: NRDE family protein [Kiloniellales bacterium]